MKKNITFEQALDRLEEIITSLEDPDTSLDQSLKLFGEGAQLISHCQGKLGDAQLKMEKLLAETQPGGTDEEG